MAGNVIERGFIKAAFVRIAPTRDTTFKASTSKYFREGGTQFFFNSKDSGFISFSHSIGWNKGALTQYKLEVVDPGDDFEQEFIATHYFNRSANDPSVTKSYFISYGVGKFDEVAWENGDLQQGFSMAQLAYLIKIDVVVGSSGARKYILLFGSLPSLRNNPSSQGWAVVDQGNRVLLTAGRAGFSLSDVKKELKKPRKPIGTTLWFGLGANVYDVDPMLENWVKFLDEGVSLCVTRYIENITGLGPQGTGSTGNVIVLMPSFRYTKLVDTMDKILSHATEREKLITNTCDVINTQLFGEFPNLESYNLLKPEHVDKMNQSSTVYKQEWKTSLKKESDGVIVFKAIEGDFNRDSREKAISIDWMKLLTSFGKKLGDKTMSTITLTGTRTTTSRTTITFRKTGKVRLDKAGTPKVETHIEVPKAWSQFGHFDHIEIRDKKRLKILKRNGLIGRETDYCFLWGEVNMMRLFLGQLPNNDSKTKTSKPTVRSGGGNTPTMVSVFSTEDSVINSEYYNQIKALFPRGMTAFPFKPAPERTRGPLMTAAERAYEDAAQRLPRDSKAFYAGVAHSGWDKETLTPLRSEVSPSFANVENNLQNIIAFVNNGMEQKAMGDSAFYEEMDMKALIRVHSQVSDTIKNSTAMVAEIGQGNYVPILRSNVRNANVIDLRLMMNPHYWGDLAGIVEDMVPFFEKRDAERTAQERLGWQEDILDGYLYAAGIDENDPRWKAWTSKIKNALWPLIEKWNPNKIVTKDTDLTDFKAQYFPAFETDFPLPKGLGGNTHYVVDVEGYRTSLTEYIMSNFIVFDRGIISRPNPGQDILKQSYLFYERLYSKAGPQMDVTTYPMFMYSRYSDIGQAMWVEMRQPNVMRGIKPKMDVLALEKKYEAQHLELGTGLYFIKAFEHTINSNSIKSRFRLHKNAFSISK